jgi:HK97 family phage major capsid protein
MTAFEEFKAANDNRIRDLERKGSADTVTVDKLNKIEQTLASHEDANQKLTLAQKSAEKAADEIKVLQKAIEKLESKFGRPGANGTEQAKSEYKAAFEGYLRKTDNGISEEERKTLREYKTLVAGNDTLGGSYVAPAEVAAEIIKNIVLMSPVRSIARVSNIGVESLKLPKRTGTFAARRVGEVETRTETQGYQTGLVEIKAPEMYAEVLISEQMIEDSMFDIESEMNKEFVEQFAVKEGAEFVAGTGTDNQAEGFITSSQVTQIVNSGTAATIADSAGQANGIIQLYYTLKTAYAKNAVFTMNRQTIGAVRQLKDSTGRYIWQPGVANAAPNTILDAPYVELPDMPAVGANTFPIAIGDFMQGYRIVDRVLISVLRDPFTQAGNGQIKFLARKRVGGAVVKGEAIAKLQCHT